MLLTSLSLSWASRTKGVAQLRYPSRLPRAVHINDTAVGCSDLTKTASVMIIPQRSKSTSYYTARKDFLW